MFSRYATVDLCRARAYWFVGDNCCHGLYSCLGPPRATGYCHLHKLDRKRASFPCGLCKWNCRMAWNVLKKKWHFGWSLRQQSVGISASRLVWLFSHTKCLHSLQIVFMKQNITLRSKLLLCCFGFYRYVYLETRKAKMTWLIIWNGLSKSLENTVPHINENMNSLWWTGSIWPLSSWYIRGGTATSSIQVHVGFLLGNKHAVNGGHLKDWNFVDRPKFKQSCRNNKGAKTSPVKMKNIWTFRTQRTVTYTTRLGTQPNESILSSPSTQARSVLVLLLYAAGL
jgi:hypothetical protein